MEQPLLLTNARGHSFRASVRETLHAQRRYDEDSDVRLFVLSFVAFFVCFYTFIA